MFFYYIKIYNKYFFSGLPNCAVCDSENFCYICYEGYHMKYVNSTENSTGCYPNFSVRTKFQLFQILIIILFFFVNIHY
jgi:hypothetical protein